MRRGSGDVKTAHIDGCLRAFPFETSETSLQTSTLAVGFTNVAKKVRAGGAERILLSQFSRPRLNHWLHSNEASAGYIKPIMAR